MEDNCERKCSDKNVEAFLGGVFSGGGDFSLGWSAVDSGVGGGFVAGAVLVHYVYGCRGANLVG